VEDIPAEFAMLLRNVSLYFIRHRLTFLGGLRHWLYIHELKKLYGVAKGEEIAGMTIGGNQRQNY